MIEYSHEDYKEKGFATVDSALSDDELEELRWWGHTGKPHGYYKGGYWAISRVAEDCQAYKKISERFINEIDLLKGTRWTGGWIFVYNNKCDGITPHADPAAMNVNVWITPDHCVADPDKNGLTIYNKKAPEDWSYEEYNKQVPKIRDYLKDANKEQIKYKYNRMMMFESNTFHETNGVHMKEGEWNRRMNVTFMYKPV